MLLLAMFLMVSKIKIQSFSLVLCLCFFVFSTNARESTSRSSQNNEEETRSSREETTTVDGDSLRSRVPRGSNTVIRDNTRPGSRSRSADRTSDSRSRSAARTSDSRSRGRSDDSRNASSDTSQHRSSRNSSSSQDSRHRKSTTRSSRSKQSTTNNNSEVVINVEEKGSSFSEVEESNKFLYDPDKQWKSCLKVSLLPKDSFVSQVEYSKYKKFCTLISKLMNNDASVVPKIINIFKNNLPAQIAFHLCKIEAVPSRKFKTPLIHSFYLKTCEKYSIKISGGLVKEPPADSAEEKTSISFDQLNKPSFGNNDAIPLSCPKHKSINDCQSIFNYLENKLQNNKNVILKDVSLEKTCPQWKKYNCCNNLKVVFEKDNKAKTLSKSVKSKKDEVKQTNIKLETKNNITQSEYFTFLKKSILMNNNNYEKLVSLKERIHQLRSINFVSVNHGNINVKKNMIKKNIKIFSDIRHFLEVDLKLSAIKVKKILKEFAALWGKGGNHLQMNNHKSTILNLFMKDINYFENIDSKKNVSNNDNSDGENDALSLLKILCD